MNILRKQKVQIPEQFREKFAGYQGIKADISYEGIDSVRYPSAVRSEIKFYLTPGNCSPRKDYLLIHVEMGPNYSGSCNEILVDKAKSLLRNEKYLENILSEVKV